MHFKNGAKTELGPCRCGKQAPGGRDRDECVWVGVDTDHHHHVLSDGGLWLTFRCMVFGLLVS